MATHKKTRRWRFLWFVLPSIPVVVVIGSALWFQFRPLNAVEQRLVGTWRNTTMRMTFTLTNDREFFIAGRPDGRRWYVNGNELHVPDTLLNETSRAIWSTLARTPNPKSPQIISFDDDNHVTVFVPINGGTFHWERLNNLLK
jgi:hypothetical protein